MADDKAIERSPFQVFLGRMGGPVDVRSHRGRVLALLSVEPEHLSGESRHEVLRAELDVTGLSRERLDALKTLQKGDMAGVEGVWRKDLAGRFSFSVDQLHSPMLDDDVVLARLGRAGGRDIGNALDPVSVQRREMLFSDSFGRYMQSVDGVKRDIEKGVRKERGLGMGVDDAFSLAVARVARKDRGESDSVITTASRAAAFSVGARLTSKKVRLAVNFPRKLVIGSIFEDYTDLGLGATMRKRQRGKENDEVEKAGWELGL